MVSVSEKYQREKRFCGYCGCTANATLDEFMYHLNKCERIAALKNKKQR